MTSWNGNIFRITGPLWGESTGNRWIPLTQGKSRRALMFSLVDDWTSEQTAVQRVEMMVIWDAMALIMTSL